MKHILKCEKCKLYTLVKECSCGGVAVTPRPAKFSPEDPYGKYRRIAKKEAMEKEGLL